MDLFFKHTQEIRDYLTAYLTEQEKNLGKFVWTKDVFSRIIDFCQSGKAIRGNSILFVAQMNNQKASDDVIAIAAAIELLHGSILMQDDVTDNDLLRRGKPSMHAQYSQVLPNHHLAESFAFYAGDIGYFLAFGMIEKANLPAEKKQKIATTLSEELVKVGLGQLQDIYVPGGKPNIETIMTTYRTKTARYTFSLPFMMGAQCADLSQTDTSKLEQLGEHIGIIFQLKDDLIDLLGTEEVTGKPVGSDIREGKYTPIILSLIEKMTPEEKEVFEETFGKSNVSTEYIQAIIELVKFYKIPEEIETLMQEENEKAKQILGDLAISDQSKQALTELLEYNLNRIK